MGDIKETEVIENETVDPNLTNDGNILASRSSVDCITPEMHETSSVEEDLIADLIAEAESLDELDISLDRRRPEVSHSLCSTPLSWVQELHSQKEVGEEGVQREGEA